MNAPTVTSLYAGLQSLGWKQANQFTFYLGCRSQCLRLGNVRFTVRFPRSAKSADKLVFEAEPSHWRNRINSMARLDVNTTEPGWVEKVANWMKAELPKAQAQLDSAERARSERNAVAVAAASAQEIVRSTLHAAGFTSKYPVVMNDGKQVCGARVEIFISGKTAEEIAEKLLAVLRQNSGN